MLLCREWAMHPNGQLPAYEWAFGDVNPPVHAWAAWQVYVIDGSRDRDFLIRVFTKLLLNFSWWVNRKDADGSNLFEGGFLGMDNIGLFDRSAPLPPGYRLEQSDATSWMAFYCLQMLRDRAELAQLVPAWDDIATKFLEHFLSIAQAMQRFGSQNVQLVGRRGRLLLRRARATRRQLPADAGALDGRPAADARVAARPGVDSTSCRTSPPGCAGCSSAGRSCSVGCCADPARRSGDLLLSLLDPDRLRADPVAHVRRGGVPLPVRHPVAVGGLPRRHTRRRSTVRHMTIDYEPGESRSGLFGGNSNWRGPIWFPVNVLLADALRTYGHYLGDEVRVEVPTGSGTPMTLVEAADVIDRRLIALFRRGPTAAGRPTGTESRRPTIRCGAST